MNCSRLWSDVAGVSRWYALIFADVPHYPTAAPAPFAVLWCGRFGESQSRNARRRGVSTARIRSSVARRAQLIDLNLAYQSNDASFVTAIQLLTWVVRCLDQIERFVNVFPFGARARAEPSNMGGSANAVNRRPALLRRCRPYDRDLKPGVRRRGTVPGKKRMARPTGTSARANFFDVGKHQTYRIVALRDPISPAATAKSWRVLLLLRLTENLETHTDGDRSGRRKNKR